MSELTSLPPGGLAGGANESMRCVSDKNAKNESERRVLRAHEDESRKTHRSRTSARGALCHLSAANGSRIRDSCILPSSDKDGAKPGRGRPRDSRPGKAAAKQGSPRPATAGRSPHSRRSRRRASSHGARRGTACSAVGRPSDGSRSLGGHRCEQGASGCGAGRGGRVVSRSPMTSAASRRCSRA